MKRYKLMPTDGRKSFYGKAVVEAYVDGMEVLMSYGTPIMYKDKSGTMGRFWSGWTQTTGRHIAAFCGLNKSGFMAIPMAEDKYMSGLHMWLSHDYGV